MNPSTVSTVSDSPLPIELTATEPKIAKPAIPDFSAMIFGGGDGWDDCEEDPKDVLVSIPVEDVLTADCTPNTSPKGFICREDLVGLIAPPKSYKTHVCLALAVAIAGGLRWLNLFPTNRCKMLYVDFENKKRVIIRRIKKISTALGVSPETVNENVEVLSLRGQTGYQALLWLNSIPPEKYDMIFLDPLYHTYGPNFNENDNAQMGEHLKIIQSIATKLKSAVVLVHHTSKGSQADKDVRDVGAGASAIVRMADVHLIIRRHEEDDCAVLDGVIRANRWDGPYGLRWQSPLYNHDMEIDTNRLHRPGAIETKPIPTVEEFVEKTATNEPQTRKQILLNAKKAGITDAAAKGLLDDAIQKKQLYEHKIAGTGKSQYATVPQETQTSFAFQVAAEVGSN